MDSSNTHNQSFQTPSNSSSSSNDYAVVIPIDPEMILRIHYPNGEILMQKHESQLPKKEGVELPSNRETGITPPPPGLCRNNNNKEDNNNKNGNINNSNTNNNSNGNGHINNEFREVSNPTVVATTATPTEKTSNFNSTDYSQSPFNPLAIMSFKQLDTPAYIPREHDENNEELSLASNQFKLFVDETLKKVNPDPTSSSFAAVKARLIIPANYSQSNKTRWGLKIFGPHADLVQAAKMEIMRSPSLCAINSDNEDEVDLETSLRTSKTIESLLFEEGDIQIEKKSDSVPFNEQITTIDFPVLNSLTGPLLGPKYHVIKEALAEFNCTIEWDGSLALLPTNSSLNMRVSGKDPKAVSSVVQMLKDRTDRIDELPLAVNTLVIDSGKLDWIYSSGAIKHVEDALWTTGATLTHLSDSVYQITCLSGALLSSCLKRLHVILSRHQSVHFTFRYRNDIRDFSTKCSEVFESLAQMTDCVVSQHGGNGGSVQVEVGGSAGDLARALIRLDTIRNQIFESGSCDLKLVERRLRLHVPAEIREFICGKKDGKLNRIIKETGVNISLNSIGGDSMYVDLISEDHMGFNFGSNVLLHALRLIEGELPAEMTFHVPEIHHKRMIGHGGKVIQRIMKKWGVYVKFMNTQETIQVHQLSDPLKDSNNVVLPLDNVVVRTPSKNGSALKAIKEEIFEECSVSDVTGHFDHESFNTLKKIQSSSKSRVSITLPLSHRTHLPSLLRHLIVNRFVDTSLRMGSEADVLILEGEKVDVSEIISEMAKELKNELEFEGNDEEIIVRPPKQFDNRSAMTVATVNPFDLLNEELTNKKVAVKSATNVTNANANKVTPTTKATVTVSATATAATKSSANKRVGELNSNVQEKVPLRRGGNNSNGRRSETTGNERQERRRTDRHSRTGYKQDGEKRLTAGKGSWGKAVEAGEEGVTVDESVAVAEQVESIELEENDNGSTAIETEPVIPHLTLAQYQATLKKPVNVTSTVTRKVNTTLPTDQIVKKETDVFVFPEIVKKQPAKKNIATKTTSEASIDVTKYISVKAVSSVEPREPREREDRKNNNSRNNNNNNRNSNARNTRNNGDRNSRPTSTATAAKSMNLKDDRSFPSLGSK